MTQKNLEKNHMGGQITPRRVQLYLIFSRTECSRIPKKFYELIFDTSESDEPIFQKLGALFSEVFLLIQIS